MNDLIVSMFYAAVAVLTGALVITLAINIPYFTVAAMAFASLTTIIHAIRGSK